MGRAATATCTLYLQGIGNELRAIVHAQTGGYRITPEPLLDRVDHLNSLVAPTHPNCQTKPALFTHHVQELPRAAIYPVVDLEVD